MSIDYGQHLMNHYRAWVAYWTGRRQFAVKAMEDSGIAAALRRLRTLSRADPQRLMVLRAGSEFTISAQLQNPVAELHSNQAKASTFEESPGRYAALPSAHLVVDKVIETLTHGWRTFRDTIPSAGENPR